MFFFGLAREPYIFRNTDGIFFFGLAGEPSIFGNTNVVFLFGLAKEHSSFWKTNQRNVLFGISYEPVLFLEYQWNIIFWTSQGALRVRNTNAILFFGLAIEPSIFWNTNGMFFFGLARKPSVFGTRMEYSLLG